MIYDVRHRTTYRYDSEVAYARCLLRLTPYTNAGQTLLQSTIAINPTPARKAIKRDAFGTQVISTLIETPHEVLAIESRCLVDVHSAPAGDLAKSAPWETVRAAILETRKLDPESPALYLYPTKAAPNAPAITEYARASFAPGRPVLEAAAELMGRLRSEFTYAPGETDVRTPATEAFANRRGVCQDFAHIMLCGLHGLGLAARYVSGYLRTIPPPGQPRLEGADATHAWVSLWCGDDCWVGFDPTNNLVTADDHIVLAYGRDYHDVSPIEGVLLGAGRQELEVEVDVIAVSEESVEEIAARG